MMTMYCVSMQRLSTALACGLMLSLVGCDYWPPALQAQIEQLRSETQTLAMEKAQLQGQVMDLSKAKQEYQSEVDELSRMNQEKTAMVMGLQKQLDRVRTKALKARPSKLTQRKATTKATVKPSGKAAQKSTRKAPPNRNSGSKSVGSR